MKKIVQGGRGESGVLECRLPQGWSLAPGGWLGGALIGVGKLPAFEALDPGGLGSGNCPGYWTTIEAAPVVQAGHLPGVQDDGAVHGAESLL